MKQKKTDTYQLRYLFKSEYSKLLITENRFRVCYVYVTNISPRSLLSNVRFFAIIGVNVDAKFFVKHFHIDCWIIYPGVCLANKCSLLILKETNLWVDFLHVQDNQ